MDKIKCPTLECNDTPKIVKIGKIYLKTTRTYNQRYLCKQCGKKFFNSITTIKQHKEKMYDLRSKIETLFCSGMTIRGIANFLKINRRTVERKLELLSIESYKTHYMIGDFQYKNVRNSLGEVKRPLIVFDEMETCEATVLKPISIGIAYDYNNKVIVSFEVASFKPRGLYKLILDNNPKLKAKYKNSVRTDDREKMIDKSFENIKSYLISSHLPPVFITDGKKSYPTHIKKHFDTQADHIIILSKGLANLDNDDAHPDAISSTGILKDPEFLRPKDMLQILSRTNFYPKESISAMATFNKLCATLRLHIAVLARSSFVQTKCIHKLHKHLLVYQNYWNRD